MADPTPEEREQSAEWLAKWCDRLAEEHHSEGSGPKADNYNRQSRRYLRIAELLRAPAIGAGVPVEEEHEFVGRGHRVFAKTSELPSYAQNLFATVQLLRGERDELRDELRRIRACDHNWVQRLDRPFGTPVEPPRCIRCGLVEPTAPPALCGSPVGASHCVLAAGHAPPCEPVPPIPEPAREGDVEAEEVGPAWSALDAIHDMVWREERRGSLLDTPRMVRALKDDLAARTRECEELRAACENWAGQLRDIAADVDRVLRRAKGAP